MILIWDGAKTHIEIVETDQQLRCLSLAIEIGCKKPIQCGPVTNARLSGVDWVDIDNALVDHILHMFRSVAGLCTGGVIQPLVIWE